MIITNISNFNRNTIRESFIKYILLIRKSAKVLLFLSLLLFLFALPVIANEQSDEMFYQVSGISMEPTLYDGDIVKTVSNKWGQGDIVIADIGDKLVIKRIVGDYLVGDNREVSAIYRTKSVKILGAVEKTLPLKNNAVTRKVYASIQFDGTDDYVLLGNSVVLKPNTYTIEAKFKMEAPYKVGAIYRWRTHAQRLYVDSAGKVSVLQYTNVAGDSAIVTSPGAYNDGNYHHVAATFDGSTLKLYIDGILVGSQPCAGIYYGSGGSAIGREGAEGTSYYFRGIIREVRLWNYARTQIQVQSDMNDNIQAQTRLIGYWKLNEGSGTVAADSSGNNINGTVNGTPNWINESEATLSTPNINQAFSKKAGNNTITFSGKVSNPSGNNITISATLGGINKTTTVLSPPTTLPGTDNWTLTWDVASDGINLGEYSDIVISSDDGNGNTASTIFQKIILINRITPTPPTINITSPVGYNTGDWTNQNVKFTITDGTDEGGVGIQKSQYSIDGGTIWNDYSAEVTLSSEDSVTIVARTIDNEGNISPVIDSTLNSYVNFDGINDFVAAADTPSLNIDYISMEAWVYITSYDFDESHGIIVNKENSYELGIENSTGMLQCAVKTAWMWKGTQIVPLNEWVHVAATWDGVLLKLYVNDDVEIIDLDDGAIADTTNGLGIGARGISSDGTGAGAWGFLKGSMDEVRVWNIARTQAEIQSTRNVELTGAEPGLVGYWKFNEGTGIAALDSTANNNNGTLYNGAAYSGSVLEVNIDKTAPTVEISEPSLATTKTTDITYTVTYAGADTVNLTSGNITLNKTGTADGTVSVLNGTTVAPTVVITNITGDGTLGITITSGTASDTAGNTAPAAGPSTTFTVDNTGPVVPTVNVLGGVYNVAQNIELTPAGDAVNTYYTLDGSEPDSGDTSYSGAIPIDGPDGETVTLKAVSYDALGNKGNVLIQLYTFSNTANKYIYYIGTTDNYIYKYDLSTGINQVVLSEAVNSNSIVISPDTANIYFSQGLDTYKINPRGGAKTLVASGWGTDRGMAVSPDNKYLYCILPSNNYISKLDIPNGTIQTVLAEAVFNNSLVVSPDGSLLYFSESSNTYKMNIDGSGKTLLRTGWCTDKGLTVSPDNKFLYGIGIGITRVYYLNLQTLSSGITISDSINPNSLRISADGSTLLFSQGIDLYKISSNGGTKTLIKAGVATDRGMAIYDGGLNNVVFYDSRYPSYPYAWVNNAATMVDYFSSRGFVVKNADALKIWMDEKINNNTAPGSVCVIAQGMMPDTVMESIDANCTARRYMDAGGRVIWVGDTPFYYRGHNDGTSDAVGGSQSIIGVDYVVGDMGSCSITLKGADWGITQDASTIQPVPVGQITTALTVSSTNSGQAYSWHKNFNPGYPYSGFVRYYSDRYDGINNSLNQITYSLSVKYLTNDVHVIYYDSRYSKNWVSNSSIMANYFNYKGFKTKNADALRVWMNEKVTSGTAPGTVCVFAQDAVPDTIVETLDTNCTLRKYLDAGGRIVWVGDVPLYYKVFDDGTSAAINAGGSILGVGHNDGDSSAYAITAEGTAWGVTTDTIVIRPSPANQVTTVLTQAANDGNLALSWHKNYNAAYPYSGFVRFNNWTYNGSDTSLNDISYRLATYKLPQIVLTPMDSNPLLTGEMGFDTITLSGRVSNPDGSDITVKASIDNNEKSVIIPSPSIIMPNSDNWILSWNVNSDNISDGCYSKILVTVSDASGAKASTVLLNDIVVDKTAPIVEISGPSSTITKNTDITYTVTYTGADTVNLTSGNITLNKAGTADGTVSVLNGTTAAPTVVITNITGDGTLGITITSGTASDTAGNTAPAAGPSTTFTVDNIGPAVPTVNVLGGVYNVAQNVELTSAGDAVNTYYTLDGSEPDSGDTSYSGVIPIDGPDGETVTLKAVSYDALGNKGNVLTQVYTFNKSQSVPGTPTVQDIGNNGDGRDIRVTFTGASDETNISEYRVIVVPTGESGTFTEAAASIIDDTRYMNVAKSGANETHTVTLTQALKDSSGAAIVNGTAYKVFVLVIGQNGYGNSLSTASEELVLSNAFFNYVNTTQTEFQQGILTNVIAIPSGELKLTGSGNTYLASAKTYTLNFGPHGIYPDTNSTEFTDGQEGAGYSDGKSFGYQHYNLGVGDGETGYLDITIDLGELKWIRGAKLCSGAGSLNGYEAGTLEILTSQDGIDYTSQGIAGDINLPVRYIENIFNAAQARYVKFHIGKKFGLLGNAGDWFFIDEGYVYECYAPTGAYLSPVLNISTTSGSKGSRISWTADMPVNTGLSIETNLSLDGGSTWQGWQSAVNNSQISGVTNITDLSNARLQYRMILTTSDSIVTPSVQDLTVSIFPLVPTAGILTVEDVGNNGDGRDIRVAFTGASDETNISEYRVIVVPSNAVGAFNEGIASGLDNTRYVSVAKSGESEIHTITLTQALKDSTGTVITNQTAYKVFVLTAGQNGYGNSLSSASEELILLSPFYNHTDTSKADFESGTLTGTQAIDTGRLELSIGNNIAGGKTYTKSHEPLGGFPDTNNTEFTDGQEGSDYDDGKSFGYQHYNLGVGDGETGYLDITIDLGELKWIRGAKLCSGAGSLNGYEAGTLEIMTSQNGIDYTSQGIAGDINLPVRYIENIFNTVQARYVKFHIGKKFGLLGNAGDWFFIDEGYVYECYAPTGAYLSPVLNISTTNGSKSSRISWTADVPVNTELSIETNLSLDGGSTWQGWQPAVNNSQISGVTNITDLSNARLQYRMILTTSDSIVTPSVQDLTVSIFPLVSAPSASPAGNTYNAAQSVTLTVSGNAVNTYYTLDGSEPDSGDTSYSGAIPIDGSDGETVTLKAVSYDALGNKGNVLTQVYTFSKTLPPLGTPTAQDIGNNGDGRDIRVALTGASDETNISEYRVIVVPSNVIGTFTEAAASGLDNTRYVSVVKSGANETHTVTLTQALKDSSGAAIVNGTAYKVFVLVIGQNGYGNSLSSGSDTFTLASELVQVPTTSPIPYIPEPESVKTNRLINEVANKVINTVTKETIDTMSKAEEVRLKARNISKDILTLDKKEIKAQVKDNVLEIDIGSKELEKKITLVQQVSNVLAKKLETNDVKGVILEDIKKIEVQTETSIDNIKVTLPAEVLVKAEDKVKLQINNVTLPTGALKTEEVVKAVKADSQAYIQVETRIVDKDVAELEQLLVFNGVAMVTKTRKTIQALELNMYLVTDRDKVKLNNLSDNIIVGLDISNKEQLSNVDKQKLVVFTKENKFLGGQYNTRTNKIEFKTKEPGLYNLVKEDITFVDIVSSPFKQYIEIIASKHITEGVSAKKYAPKLMVTRAQMAVLVQRILELEPKEHKGIFRDVTKNKWYSEAVETVVELGIMEEVSKSRFMPDKKITNEELTTILMKSYYYMSGESEHLSKVKTRELDKASLYSNNKIKAAYVKKAIESACDGDIKPKSKVSRQTLAKVIVRFMNEMQW